MPGHTTNNNNKGKKNFKPHWPLMLGHTANNNNKKNQNKKQETSSARMLGQTKTTIKSKNNKLRKTKTPAYTQGYFTWGKQPETIPNYKHCL